MLLSLRSELRGNIKVKTEERVAAATTDKARTSPTQPKDVTMLLSLRSELRGNVKVKSEERVATAASSITAAEEAGPTASPVDCLRSLEEEEEDDFEDHFYDDDEDYETEDDSIVEGFKCESTAIEAKHDADQHEELSQQRPTPSPVSPTSLAVSPPPSRKRKQKPTRRVPKEWERTSLGGPRQSSSFVVDDTVRSLYAAQAAYGRASEGEASPYTGSWMEREQQKIQMEIR